ncbi:hypothetical protein ACIBH1_05450 [Nonomuraea sp. NPDC050663]|uniref:hypothetical protein n=1 Tax=Nonomuraea sp. NPDC050663 TaxID=3364370 RepID=UPI0037A14084
MADRTVTTRLKLAVTEWTAGKSTVTRDLKDLNRQFTASSGFVSGFRKKLEDATKRLPKIEIDADSTEADVAVAKLRDDLEKLSQKTIGVDIDAADAFAEMARIQAELADLGDGASFEVRAGIEQATRDLALVATEVGRLDGTTVDVKVDVDTKAAMPKFVEFGDSAGGALAAAVRSAAGPALLTGLGGVAIGAGVAVGAAMGGAIVAGIGARLVTLGVTSLFHIQEIDKQWSAVEKRRVEAANKQAKELRDQFAELGRDLNLAVQESSRPMLSVLDEVRTTARDVAKDVAPNLADGFDRARVPMEQFVRDLGDGLKDLGDSIPSLMDGFSDVLSEIDIDGFLSDLGDALSELGRKVSENRGAIGAVLNGLLDVIPLAITGLGKLVDFLGFLSLAGSRSAATVASHFADASSVITGMGTRILQVTRSIGQALSNVPGLEEFGRKIVAGADDGIAKLKEFQKEADEASRRTKLQADIVELQQGIDKALTLLDDPNLTKERRAQLSAEVRQLLHAKGEALLALGDPKLIAEYRSEITSDISALQSRLAAARKELQDPELTKERRSRLNAEIRELQAAVKLAQTALASIKDRTVTVRVKILQDGSVRLPDGTVGTARAMGSIDRYAAGGIRTATRPQPPNLVNRPTVLYGEGSSGTGATEAFIPYEPRFRRRAVDLLGRVAQDFGLKVYNADAGMTVAKFTSSMDAANQAISGQLGQAHAALMSTLGAGGSLTGSIDQVAQVGESMTAGWVEGSTVIGESVTAMGGIMAESVVAVGVSVDGLTGATDHLAAAVERAISATSVTGDGGKMMSSTSVDYSDGPIEASAKETRGKLKGKSSGSKSGNSGVAASAKETRGKLSGSISATASEARGRLPGGMVPGDPGPNMAWVSGGMGSLAGAVNTARVSRPQMVPPHRTAAPAASPDGRAAGSAGAAGGDRGLVQVMGDLVVNHRADADLLAARLYARTTSKGPL